jgi:hypothetical protein
MHINEPKAAFWATEERMFSGAEKRTLGIEKLVWSFLTDEMRKATAISTAIDWRSWPLRDFGV